MEELYSLYNETLAGMFKKLEYTGMLSNRQLRSIVTLDNLIWILDEFEGLITESDYNMIVNQIRCLSQDECLIPAYTLYRSTMRNASNTYNLFNQYRITENGIARNTEDADLRISETNLYYKKPR